jgi:predicted MFS family arabinose efflux permease
LIVVHAVFAAVQDVAIDTLAIETVPASELGRVNGAMQAGMLAGRAAVAAGSAVVAAALDTPGAAVACVMALVLLPAVVLLVAVTEPRVERPMWRVQPVLRLVRAPVALAGAAIALLIGAGFEFFGVSAGPLLVEQGQSEAVRATFYGLLAPAGLAGGAMAGGFLADRLGVIRATAASLAVLSAVLVFVALDDLAPGLYASPVPLFALVYCGIGALTASSYALFMTLSRGEFAATRFSVFMAMTNACEAWAGFVGGRFAVHGYGLTLLSLTAVSCMAALPLAIVSKSSYRREVNETGRRTA